MIKIRPLTSGDSNGVRFVDELTQIQYLGSKWKQLSSEQKESHLKSRQSEFKTNVNTGYGFVATENNETVGFVFAHETLPFHGSLFIRHIAIKPEYHGQGLGTLLIQAVIKKAKKSGIKKIISLINPDNPKSMNMHKKAGFELIDRKEAKLRLN